MKYLKKSSSEEEVDSEGSWAISYGDMITLLLSFFVIFFSADFKQQKIEKMNRHLSFDLDVLGRELDHKQGPQVLSMPTLKELDIQTTQIGENLVITFGATSFFESGSTEVKPEARKILESFVSKYLPYAGTYQLSVKGFTDKRRVRKMKRKYQDNLELSVLRGVATMRVLQKAGIPLNRMEIAGVGEMKSINTYLKAHPALNEKEINALSRTIVLVVKPERENWL